MVALESGSILAGRYRLERMLAQGGMGAVWVARHLQLDVNVAVKLIRPHHAGSAAARARFEREAKASAQLRSPYVVQIFDYGIDDDAPFIVMELLEGEELQARLKREKRLSLAATQRVVHQVCKALRLAHDAGLVHRDLKPGNVFLARQGGEETAKVLDFGIAKVLDPAVISEATETGTLLGSPQYMSPEQVRSAKQVDPRSDLWSLGVIIFRCLTGALPFTSDELGDLLMEICADQIPLASQIAPDLGAAVDQFLARALLRDPDLRFQSADELDAAFAAIASADAGARIPSTPPPAPLPGRLMALTESDALTESLSRSKVDALLPAPTPPASTPVALASTLASAPTPPILTAEPAGRPPLPRGTFQATSGHSLALQPSRSGRRGLLVGAGLLVAALIFAAGFLVRAPTNSSPEVVAASSPTASSEPAPVIAAAPPPPAPPSASVSAAHPSSSRPPPRGTSSKLPSRPSSKPDDPLREM